jgi:hypothetical protein
MTTLIKAIIGTVVLVVALLVLWIFLGAPGVAPVSAEQFDAQKGIPPLILENFRRWELIANSLRILQVGLGVIGTAAALLVTTFTSELGTFRTKILTFVAAFCLGTLTAFDIGGKANQTRNAWREVAVAVIKYQHTKLPSEQAFDDLIAAYKRAEEIVGDVAFRSSDPQPQATPKPKAIVDSATASEKDMGR